MQPLVFVTREDTTCRDAINQLHETAADLEMIFYLYIENDGGQLVGVTSLRALLTHPPSTPLVDFMITEVITVSPETDQEEVARIVSRYDMLAVPVVDEGRRLPRYRDDRRRGGRHPGRGPRGHAPHGRCRR